MALQHYAFDCCRNKILYVYHRTTTWEHRIRIVIPLWSNSHTSRPTIFVFVMFVVSLMTGPNNNNEKHNKTKSTGSSTKIHNNMMRARSRRHCLASRRRRSWCRIERICCDTLRSSLSVYLCDLRTHLCIWEKNGALGRERETDTALLHQWLQTQDTAHLCVRANHRRAIPLHGCNAFDFKCGFIDKLCDSVRQNIPEVLVRAHSSRHNSGQLLLFVRSLSYTNDTVHNNRDHARFFLCCDVKFVR